MKFFSCKLRTFIVAGVVVLTLIPFSNIALAFDRNISAGSIPIEVLAATLRSLIKSGNYKSFLDIAKRDGASFQTVIAIDPVLKRTLEGLRDEELRELMDRLIVSEPNNEDAQNHLVKSIFDRIAFLSDRVSNDPVIQAQVSGTLAGQFFNLPLVNLPVRPSVLLDIAKYLPVEDLPLLDSIVKRMLATRLNDRASLVIRIYSKLIKNNKLPLGTVVDMFQGYSQALARSEPSHFSRLILQIAQCPNIDERTIQYFKENESNPEWEGSGVLMRALDIIKANPMYSRS